VGGGGVLGEEKRSRRGGLDGESESASKSDNKAPEAERGLCRHEEVTETRRGLSGARVACTGYIKRGQRRWAAAG
jgi:hypothetical protein